MTTATNTEREQKINQYMSNGYDRLTAENLVDGLPSWNQRITNPPTPVDMSPAAVAQRKYDQERIANIDKTTLGDLEGELWAITEQLDYWNQVKESAQLQVKQAKSRVNAAKSALAELRDLGGQQAKYDRKMAQDTMDTQATRLEFVEKRLKNAEVQIKAWTIRNNNFDYSKLKKLQKDAMRRDQMSGRISGQTPDTEPTAESI